MTEHARHHEHAKTGEATTPRQHTVVRPTVSSTQPRDSTAAIYGCPMHPQIRRTAPGNCPICGMALEPEMPTLEEEKNPELEDLTRRFWWTLPLSVAGVVIAMGGHRFMPVAPGAMSWVELALSTPVVLWAGWPLLVRCVDSIRHRSPNFWSSFGFGVTSPY